jgi:ATP-dependent RNA circularization protein (DNA/RNA ligase family)
MARKYNIQEVLNKAFPNKNIALQGEVCGPGIQGNNLGLKDLEFHLFNLYDIDSRIYLDYDDIISFTKEYNIPMVTEIQSGTVFSYTVEELVALARTLTYETGKPAEGMVIRPQKAFYSNILKKYWSGKVLNELYKEKD